MATLKQVVDVLETLYPLRYAEQWDEPGLIVGDLRQPVRGIAFAADPSMAVVDQAIAGGIDLLVCHHPLFFRSVHAVSGLGFRGEIVRKLNLAGCALWVGHTNADAAYRASAWLRLTCSVWWISVRWCPSMIRMPSIRSVWGVWGVLPNLWRCVISPVE